MPPKSPMLSLIAASALLLTSCATASTTSSPTITIPSAACPSLPTDAGWYGDNHQRLQAMIVQLGDCTGSGNVAEGAPLALFDWDNTVVKNDIGDATTFWMLANGKVLQPTSWSTVSTFMTPEAAQALTTACGALTPAATPLPTHSEAGTACADEILSVYSEGETTSGSKAFANYNARRIEPQYAFAAQLLAGYSETDIMDFARQARQQNLEAEEGTLQQVGTEQVTGWVRYYRQVSDLITTLKGNGFDVRIVSASAEPVVRVWAEEFGLTGDQVMGVTMRQEGELMTSTLMPCGDDEAAMTYIEGKRCRINEQVFGITGATAFETAAQTQRPAFSAGDSDTDVSFMVDATALRLVINRNKTELMCHAYDNEDGAWIINPMFLGPADKRDQPYPCSTAGEILPDGGAGPLKDTAGHLIGDQEDTVFG